MLGPQKDIVEVQNAILLYEKFHYELEVIHPFMDGNGRMGRLWQQLLLAKANPIFKFVTVEELIKENQEGYYGVLA